MKRVAGNRKTAARRQTRGEHLLDVRVRRSTAKRRTRSRRLHFVLGCVLWISLAVGSIFGFRAIVNKFFLQNPEYNLRVVEVELDDLMSRDEAMRIAGLNLGTNIFRIDLAAADHAFRQIDQIETVSLQRDWPDKVTIQLKKRIPIAWLARTDARDLSAQRTLLLDASGRTMKPYRVEQEYWRLPVIYTPDPALIQQGDILATADLRAALDLLTERKRRADSLLEIESIDVSKGYEIEVVDASKATFIFAPQDLAPQLERLEKLLVNSRDTGRKIETVNLIPKKYTPVRYVLAAAPEAAPPPAPSGNHTPEKKR